MLGSIIFSAFATWIIFVIIENLRKSLLVRNITGTNEKFKEYIGNFLGEIKTFDIFLVRQLREMLHEDFIKKEEIHGFELIMMDSRHLKIAYEMDGHREEIEISTEFDRVQVKEIGWLNDVEEIY